jgi:acetyl-CoA acetyltransferase
MTWVQSPWRRFWNVPTLTTLVHEMGRRSNVRYGLATMCIGVGQGIVMVVKRGR